MKKNILIWIFAVFLLVQIVSGALNCNDISFYESAGAKCDGTNFTAYYDNSNAFAPNVNLTINYTGATLSLVSGDNPAVNVGAPYPWKFNCSQDGTYNFNLTVEDTTSSDVCYKNMSLSLTTGIQNPNITLQLDDLTTLVINKSTNFSLILNNTGNGTAFNISGFLNDNAVFNSTLINLSSLENSSVATLSYSMTPTSCGADTLTATVNNYKNSIGQLMDPVSDNDNFNVIGTDLTVLSIDLSSTSLTEGNTLTINASIKNQGNYNASGSKITFYYDNVSDSNKKITVISLNDSNLMINGTDNVSTTWDVAQGTYRIYGIVSSDYECPLDNNQEQSLELNAGAKTEDTSSGGSTRSTTSSDAPISVIEKEQVTGNMHIWVLIMPDKLTTMNIDEKELAITKISFILKEKAENVEIAVKNFKERPSKVKEIEKEVYLYVTIGHKNLGDNIKNAVIEFKVDKSWLNANNLDKETTKLNRYSEDKWVELKTNIKDEDGDYVYYSAKTSGFSVFAITAEKVANETMKEAKNETKEEEQEKTVEMKKEEKKIKRFSLIDKIKNAGVVLKNKIKNGIITLKDFFSKIASGVKKVFSIEEARYAALGFIILGILIAFISGFRTKRIKKKKKKKKKKKRKRKRKK